MNTRIILFYSLFMAASPAFGMEHFSRRKKGPYPERVSRKPNVQRLIDPNVERSFGRAKGAQRVLALIEIPSLRDYSEGEAYNTIALRLVGNGLQTLPDLRGYAHLEELDASNNKLTELPRSIFCCTLLQRLFLQYNFLTTLPRFIVFFELLTVLDIARNRLIELPDEIGTLTGLKLLDVSHNHLTALPTALFGLEQHLQYLNITANKIPATTDYEYFKCKLPKTTIEY